MTVVIVVAFSIEGCGAVGDAAPNAGAADAAADQTPSTETRDAAGDTANPSSVRPANSGPRICLPEAGAVAPNGKPCDYSRIVRQEHGTKQTSCAEIDGYCDVISFETTTDRVADNPAGVHCSYELGVAFCYLTDDAANAYRRLDDATLDLLCALTQRFPESTFVCAIAD